MQCLPLRVVTAHLKNLAKQLMFESLEAYEKLLQRDRNITKIKREVELWSFGGGLSDETLEQILELIEGKQP